jgi:hypothetical protein
MQHPVKEVWQALGTSKGQHTWSKGHLAFPQETVNDELCCDVLVESLLQ